MLLTATMLFAACPSGSNAGDKIDAGDKVDAGDNSTGAVAPKLEITPGAGRLQGGQFTLDVQLGHPIRQQPTGSGNTQLDPRSAVKP
jgi:hypothetical protein